MSSGNSRFKNTYKYKSLSKGWQLEFHSKDWNPTSPEDIKIMVTPNAAKAIGLIRPLLERSYEKYMAGTSTEIVCPYNADGENIIIVTWRDDGHVHQMALLAEDLALPEYAPVVEFIDAIKASGKIVHPGGHLVISGPNLRDLAVIGEQ